MSDSKQYTLDYLGKVIAAEVEGDGNCIISGLQTIQKASSGELSFLANASYQKYLSSTQAAAVILHPDMARSFSGNKLIAANPYVAYAKLTHLFDNQKAAVHGVHPTAVIESSAVLGERVSIGANVYIGEHVVLRDDVIIGANSSVGDNTIIGARSRLYANVSVYHGVTIGEDVILHSTCVIGADGFGNAHEMVDGKPRWIKIHQLGGVTIGNRVEIGASTTIDRGALDDTIIEDGVIIDNHIMIGHNVKIGENTAMAGTSCIAGSTTVGKNCIIAGGVGIAGHLTIADGVHFTATTLVSKSVSEPGSYSSGTVMQPTNIWRKNVVRFGQLDKLAMRISKLEKLLAKLSAKD